MDLYEILDIEKHASSDEIKRAYRMKSKDCHPDAGGDPAKFRQLVKAYNVLFDEEKRKKYDSGESLDSIQAATMTDDMKIISILTSAFVQAIEMIPDISKMDVFKLIRDNLNSMAAKGGNDINQERRKIEKFEKAIKRVSCKGDRNIFEIATRAQIDAMQKGIELKESDLEIIKGAIHFLEAYSYDFEAATQVFFSSGQSGAIQF